MTLIKQKPTPLYAPKLKPFWEETMMNNNFPSRETVERIRKQYPVGCRVELLRMDDAQAPPIGTKGTVRYVDDIGSLGVAWDNGSSLQVVYGEDLCRRCDDDK